MGTNNIVFLEVIEWFDDSGQELAHRIPQEGSGEIKWGAQLTVRESQAAVFFYNGKAVDALGPGRHTLKTMNIPILTKILSAPWGMTSPLRAEVYMANMKVFPNLKWGTRDPVAFRDSELGLIRLRAFGVFNIRVIQPVLFINSLVGTKASYGTEDLEEYLIRSPGRRSPRRPGISLWSNGTWISPPVRAPRGVRTCPDSAHLAGQGLRRRVMTPVKAEKPSVRVGFAAP